MPRRKFAAGDAPMPRGALTTDQQRTARSRLMQGTTRIIDQLNSMTERPDGRMIVNGVPVELTPSRLAAYKVVLDRTIPILQAVSVEHTSPTDGLDTGVLIQRLATLAREHPELRDRLREAMGERLVIATADPSGD